MGRDWPGSSGNVPDDGGKNWRFYELLDSTIRNLSWHGTPRTFFYELSGAPFGGFLCHDGEERRKRKSFLSKV